MSGLPTADALISAHRMLPPGSTVLCAVSGGADSVCLLHLLHTLSPDLGFTLRAAHYNHQLRGEESDRDEAFVRQLCRQLSVPLTVGRGDVAAFAGERGLSTEEAARTLRYAFLSGTAEETGCTLIATAHTADDNAETLLLNLIRGAGIHGLTGIPPRRGNIIRPLLTTSRKEVESYLERSGLSHVEDSTNADVAYTRNKLRRQVLPLLRELNPRAADHINAAAEQLAAADRYLDREARQYLAHARTAPGQVFFPMEVLRRAPEALRPRVLLCLLETLPVGRKDFGAVHLEAVLALKNGRQLDLPHGVTASCRSGLLALRLATPAPAAVALVPSAPLSWGEWTLTLLDRPQGCGLSIRPGGELTVGPCPPGERLDLPGGSGPRTVKRLCLDRGIGLDRRDRLPAFYVDGRLAAVWPLGTGREFEPQTPEFRFIQIKHIEENGK